MNPRWLAPELMQGERATLASDVFAYGVVLWEAMTWQLPWGSANPWTVSHAAAWPWPMEWRLAPGGWCGGEALVCAHACPPVLACPPARLRDGLA